MNPNHLKNIQSVLDEYTFSNQVAGVNVLVYKDNKEAGYWQSGYADVAAGKKYNRDTICRMYSMSKTITSAAVFQLIQAGKLELGQNLATIIPEFSKLHSSRPILIQDLLNMTSGYGYGATGPGTTPGDNQTAQLIDELNQDAAGEGKITTQQVAQRLAAIPPNFEPGTDYQYGLSADILGAVVEKVTGQRLSTWLNQNIFEPLGMTDTAFYVPADKQSRLANVYKTINTPDGKAQLELFQSCNLGIQHKMDHLPSFESGGAGLCSTIDDYMKFGLMLLNRGKYKNSQILNPKTVDFMSTATLTDNLQNKFDQKMEHLSGYTYCNLLRIAIQPGKCKVFTTKGEYGWDGWLGPYLGIDPANSLVIVMTMQKTDAGTWDLTRKIKNIIYSS